MSYLEYGVECRLHIVFPDELKQTVSVNTLDRLVNTYHRTGASVKLPPPALNLKEWDKSIVIHRGMRVLCLEKMSWDGSYKDVVYSVLIRSKE